MTVRYGNVMLFTGSGHVHRVYTYLGFCVHICYHSCSLTLKIFNKLRLSAEFRAEIPKKLIRRLFFACLTFLRPIYDSTSNDTSPRANAALLSLLSPPILHPDTPMSILQHHPSSTTKWYLNQPQPVFVPDVFLLTTPKLFPHYFRN